MNHLPINPLSPEEQQRIMEQMYLLMGKQVQSYHKHRHMGNNSSVQVELAQELMESIEYTIGLVGGVYAHRNIGEALVLGQEVLEQPVVCRALGGMEEKELRERSHRPQDFYGKPHFMPSPDDGKVLLLVNMARCKAREAELLAVKAFRDAEGLPTRPDLVRALNRLSSFLYLIMIELKE